MEFNMKIHYKTLRNISNKNIIFRNKMLYYINNLQKHN